MENKQSNYPKFMLLWAGELISAVGGGLTSFGLGVYVFRQTGSAAGMALVTLMAFLPTLLLGMPAGILADRYDRRLLMMIGDGFSALGVGYILYCMANGGATLAQICIGVFISAIFSSLLEPSYRATVTDLLSREEYSKASGLVSIAGNARYLISPILAGALLAVSDIKLLLIIDICTFALTVVCTAVVRKSIHEAKPVNTESFVQSFRHGWHEIASRRGILILVLVASVMTCFLGTLQILAEPLILDFTDSATLGVAETICACGMLVSSLLLGIRGLRRGYVKILCAALFGAGVCMVGFGVLENIYVICIFGFLFFAMLPFAQNCLDVLVRSNIPNEVQGRTWGIIGFLSQLGYVAAYGAAGVCADGIARSFHIGVGRGAAWAVMIAGVLLAITAMALYPIKSVRKLEAPWDKAV